MTNRTLIVFVAFLGLCNAARTLVAQIPEFIVEKWTTAQGLPNSNVHGVAQSEDGFLWIGTEHGLARFDGEQFSVSTGKSLLPAKTFYNVQRVATGLGSQVYLGSKTGIFAVLDRGRARLFGRLEGGAERGSVTAILPVDRDEAWFGTKAGHLFHYRHGSAEEVSSSDLPHAAIYGLGKAPDGTLWIGTQRGLFTLYHDRIQPYKPKIPLPGNGIYDLTITDAGNIYVSNDRGLFRLQGDLWRRWTMKDGLPSDVVEALAAAPGDVVWMGTEVGVAQLTEGRVRAFETPLCSAIALTLDSDRSLWVGCDESKGLFRLSQPPVRILSLPGKLHGAATRSLAEDKAGPVWIATPHGVLRWWKTKWSWYTMKDGLPSSNVWSVSVAPDGKSVWITTENGFARMRDDGIKSFRTQKFGPDDGVASMLQDHSGTLWIGATRGLLRQRSGHTDLEAVRDVPGLITSVREDHLGNIWATTFGHGLFRLSADSRAHFTTDSGLASNATFDMVETGNGDIWVATQAGLSRIRNGKCASIRAENGLPPDGVVSINRDSQGHLFGIAGMKERARRINGQLQITSILGEGTRVALKMPNTDGWSLLSGFPPLYPLVQNRLKAWRRRLASK